MIDETADVPEMHKVSFSFDYHKSNLKHSSAELYSALRTMQWSTKSS